uniref:YEATS domain-containing protein n=1 Tax=Favella ehrenbergii TaxID=182087 RepID=A0A7S3HWI0_9SPIT|mmetsp:Transcript_14256/g.17927  ORF Transcript_14256/g.17927 Transcript_14256/m.17927 type:complete len:111 (+) Transcript_14256:589-921(+)
MFMSLSNDVEETAKFIKSVTYHLHPTFKPSVIKVSEAPFLLSRLGWGYFDVEMEVEFQPSTGLGKKNLVHELCFDEDGKTQSFLIEANAENDANFAASLAAQMDKLTVSK